MERADLQAVNHAVRREWKWHATEAAIGNRDVPYADVRDLDRLAPPQQVLPLELTPFLIDCPDPEIDQAAGAMPRPARHAHVLERRKVVHANVRIALDVGVLREIDRDSQ